MRSIAHVTGDGYIRRLGEPTEHDYGRSVPAEIVIPMNGRETRMTRGLNNAEVRLTIRSALAQLGLDGGVVEETNIRINSDHALVTTVLTEWHETPVIDAIANVARERIRVSIGRLALLPQEAKVPYEELADEDLPFEHTYVGDDRISIPLGVDAYRYDGGHLSRREVEEILRAPSAREALAQHRQTRPDALLNPEEYFHLASMHVNAPSHHVVLRNEVLRHGKVVPSLRHGNAMFLDRHRTRGERQAELFGQLLGYGKPTEYSLLADIYRAAPVDPDTPVS